MIGCYDISVLTICGYKLKELYTVRSVQSYIYLRIFLVVQTPCCLRASHLFEITHKIVVLC